MPYSQFTSLEDAVEQFALAVVETTDSLVSYQALAPSHFFQEVMQRELSWAIAVGTEKARSEAIILQLLLEAREQLERRISVFSGREFNVDVTQGLNGYCDFLISRAPQQTVIAAPAAVVVEAKKGDLSLGLGQCVAQMVAAQKFNSQRERPLPFVYGSVSSGTVWQFLKLQGQELTIGLNEYPMPPVDIVLGMLVAMVGEEG